MRWLALADRGKKCDNDATVHDLVREHLQLEQLANEDDVAKHSGLGLDLFQFLLLRGERVRVIVELGLPW
jgi:hypothetical protein